MTDFIPKRRRILQALVTEGRPALTVAQVARKAGVTPADAAKILSRAYRANQCASEKAPGESYRRYWMEDAHIAGHQRSRAPLEFDMDLDAVGIPGRLTFLQRLKENEAFKHFAVLDLMIGDYRRALVAAAKREDA